MRRKYRLCMEKNMKHCFIINPASGKQTTKEGLDVKIAELCSKRGADFDIFFTQKSGDASAYIADYLHEDPAEEIRFYACGGDGTVSECVNGFMSREDRSNMSLGPRRHHHSRYQGRPPCSLYRLLERHSHQAPRYLSRGCGHAG